MNKFTAKMVLLLVATILIQQFFELESKACNVAVVSARASATGRPFIWKNRDHPESYRMEMQYFSEKTSGVGGSLRLMGETLFGSGTVVTTAGSNASGFAIATPPVMKAHFSRLLMSIPI